MVTIQLGDSQAGDAVALTSSPLLQRKYMWLKNSSFRDFDIMSRCKPRCKNKVRSSQTSAHASFHLGLAARKLKRYRGGGGMQRLKNSKNLCFCFSETDSRIKRTNVQKLGAFPSRVQRNRLQQQQPLPHPHFKTRHRRVNL